MILGYSKRASFEADIIAGIKIHTIRIDPNNRWKAGRVIHHAMGVRSKRYREFMRSTCTGTQDLKIWIGKSNAGFPKMDVFIDGKHINQAGMDFLAWRDGFKDWADMEPFAIALCTLPRTYNTPRCTPDGLKIIHWTNFRY